MRYLRYAMRRLAALIPVLIGVTALTFVLVRVLPGDPILTVVPETATAADIDAARARFGLDEPIPVQFGVYLGDVIRGDLGRSFRSGGSVTDEVLLRLGATLELTTLAMVLAVIVSVVTGIAAARRRGRVLDQLSRVLTLGGNAVPEFWLGLLLILAVYFHLGWVPAPIGRLDPGLAVEPLTGATALDALLAGNLAAFRSVLAHLALPVLTLLVVVTAPLLRSVRAAALEVMETDAYRCAVAHGVAGRTLLVGHLVKPSLAGLSTLVALIYGNLLGGAVLVEFVFSWQGFGQWGLRGLLFRDYPVIQAFVLVTAAFYVVLFLVADLIHAALDPRVRL